MVSARIWWRCVRLSPLTHKSYCEAISSAEDGSLENGSSTLPSGESQRKWPSVRGSSWLFLWLLFPSSLAKRRGIADLQVLVCLLAYFQIQVAANALRCILPLDVKSLQAHQQPFWGGERDGSFS